MVEKTTKSRKLDTRKMAIIGFMGALSIGLSYLEIPMAFFAPWLKLNFSYVPMLLIGFSMGLGEAFSVLAITHLIWLLRTDSFGVGQLADLMMGTAILLPAVLCYLRNKTKKNALIGMLIGVLLMVVTGVLANRFILLPVFLGDGFNAYLDQNPLILWTAVAPFNLIKGLSISVVTFVLYKRLSPFLHKEMKA